MQEAQKCYYAFATDDGSDEQEKLCPLLLLYRSPETGLVRSGFLDMAVCNQATAANMFDAIDQKMTIYDITWTKCIGYGGGNASVMMGCRSSFLTKVKALSPSVYAVDCPCHLIHLCASKGAAKLSVNV